MRSIRSFSLIVMLTLSVASVAPAATTYSPPISSFENFNFRCVAQNVGTVPVQVTAQMIGEPQRAV